MKGMAVAMALAQLRNAKEILASHPIESWMAPQNIETYEYLTEHVIREAKEALEYFGYGEDGKKLPPKKPQGRIE